MEDKEFVLEALKRLVPDTSWWGESRHDDESIDNIKLLGDMFDIMLRELLNDSYVPEGNKGIASYESIAKAKQEVIDNIRYWLPSKEGDQEDGE